MSWSTDVLPEWDYSRDSGFEWRWERLAEEEHPARVRYPHVEAFVVDESSEVVTSLGRAYKQHAALKEPLSLRCTFCRLLHGEPSACPKMLRRPPEDIALPIAQAVGCLHGQWYGKVPRVLPGMVLKCAEA